MLDEFEISKFFRWGNGVIGGKVALELELELGQKNSLRIGHVGVHTWGEIVTPAA